MAYVTIFPPNGKAKHYAEATNVKVDGGVITFYATRDDGMETKTVTNVGFIVVEPVGGKPRPRATQL
jgi:hypothetical protein